MTTGRTGGADELKPRTKAARLRALMGLIEAKLKKGVQHADILEWLNGEGLELTERTIPKRIKLGSTRASGWISTEVYDRIDDQTRKARRAA